MVKDKSHLIAVWAKVALFVDSVSPCHYGPVRIIGRRRYRGQAVLVNFIVPTFWAREVWFCHICIDQSAIDAAKREMASA